jgi:hypothetical protein
VNVRTLARWCDRSGIRPEESKGDRRSKVLVQGQIDELCRLYARPQGEMGADMTNPAGSELQALRTSINEVNSRLDTLTSQINTIQTSLWSLHSWVANAMDTFASQRERIGELEDMQRRIEQAMKAPVTAGGEGASGSHGWTLDVGYQGLYGPVSSVKGAASEQTERSGEAASTPAQPAQSNERE